MISKVWQSKKGFTLVELLVVIAIIGVLVTIVLIAINPVRVIQNSQDTKHRSELNQVKTALQLYYNENKRYPTAGATGEFFSTPAAPAIPFTTTYLRDVAMLIGIDYSINATTGDYLAYTTVNHGTADDTNSVTKCGGTGTNRYYICPD
jgi:prepilin-type N-terminal cleavage/methylation domain-containing protein